MAVKWVIQPRNVEMRLPYRVVMPPSHRESGSDHFHAVMKRAAEWIDEHGRGTVTTGIQVDHIGSRAQVRTAYWFDDQQTAAMFKVFFG